MLLTNEIKRAIQKARSICLDFQPATDIQGSWERDRKEVTIELTMGTSAAKDQTRVTFEGFRGWIPSGHKDQMETVNSGFGVPYEQASKADSNVFSPDSGRWLDIHSDQNDHLQSIFRVIPTGSQLTFRMALDWHSNPLLIKRGVHVDVLIIEARPPQRKNGREARPLKFNLAIEATEHTKNRFGNW